MKEAPDKIYIPIIEEDGKRLICTNWWEVDTSPQNAYVNETIPYIRKDALLDYSRQRVEELKSPLNGVFGSTEREHCNERISELLLLIDKLNEM